MKKFICGPEWDERIVTLDPAKKIGILMSSGVDSTTLFKLILDNFPDTEIRLFNVQTSWDPKKPLIDEILSKLGSKIKLEVVGEKRHDWEIFYLLIHSGFQDGT
jgi:3'-phosphoadenosine 5'-phosphosulfate sulfotransferase (PAPS reductase)/FAD synthetase